MNVCGLFLLTFSVFFHNYLQILLSRGTKLIDATDKNDTLTLSEEFNLVIGQIVEFDAVSHEGKPVVSEVVGIDSYRITAENGETKEWTSYTLKAVKEDIAGAWVRWWAVNVPGLGPHFYRAASSTEEIPSGARRDMNLSGLVQIESTGDSSLSTNTGRLSTYLTSNGVYAEEVFYDEQGNTVNESLIRFIGVPKADA